MPREWTDKDERKYEAIKESSRESGKPLRVAKEIAARTVNKQRRLEGRTSNRRTHGTGNPKVPLGERTRDELYNLAREHGIVGRSRMSKAQLVRKLGG